MSETSSAVLTAFRGATPVLAAVPCEVNVFDALDDAYLVYSPALLDSLPETADGIATLSRFISLMEGAITAS